MVPAISVWSPASTLACANAFASSSPGKVFVARGARSPSLPPLAMYETYQVIVDVSAMGLFEVLTAEL
jgi:hypothetical protein